jgi:hypothetical protein
MSLCFILLFSGSLKLTDEISYAGDGGSLLNSHFGKKSGEVSV